MKLPEMTIEDWILMYNMILVAEVPFKIVCINRLKYEIRFIDTAGKCFKTFTLTPRKQ